MLNYNTLNWENFKYKNSPNLNKAFEALSYCLFCYEFDQKYGIHRYFNQAGIETDPINYNGEIIGFQAKYYDDTVNLSDKKEELKLSIKTTKEKYQGISKIIFYCNKEFSQSRIKTQSKPKYLEKIEEFANKLFIKIEWRMKSNFEKMLLDQELSYQFNLFFNPEFSEKYIDISKINKQHFTLDENTRIKRYIKRIENETIYYENEVEKILKNENKIILLSDAGNGKTEECKYITNILNEKKENFAFYNKLSVYHGEKLEELIPKEYKEVCIDNLIFVLDGFDEIAIEYRRMFVINLEAFCNNYKNVKIILTSRNNFYNLKNKNQNGTIEGFNEYILECIKKENINELLQRNGIDEKIFWKEIGKCELSHLVYNPFFLIKIIEIYNSENKLPNKTTIFDNIINRSLEVDKNKFKNANDLDDFEKNVKHLLGIVAITMEFLERNYLTEEEYKELISDVKERKIIEYTSIWKKQDKEHWGFIHKNFGEYLAAQSIKKYSIKDIEEIITYHDKIKTSWVNTLIFLISFGRDDLLDYIIERMPEFVLYIENNKFDLEFRKKIFRKIFEKYENKKIWIDYNISEKFNLISDGEDILYLLEKISKNNHYTITVNALKLLQTAEGLFGHGRNVMETLLHVCKSNDYVNYSKSMAIKTLADFNLCSRREFKDIININKKNENSELRRAYYYFIKKRNLVSQDIDIILERYKYIAGGLRAYNWDDEDDEPYSFDEYMEFTNCFKELKTKNSINKVLKFFSNEKIRDTEINKDIINNIFDSIIKIYTDSSAINILIKLYLICEQQYDYKIIKEFINRLKNNKLLLDFFKEYLNSNNKKRLREYEYIIDDECMEYFYKEYKNGKYDNQIAEDILRFCSKELKFYKELKNEYKIKTGKEIFEYIPKKKIDSKLIREKSKKIFIDKMFDKNEFLEYFKGFLKSLNKDEISIKDLHELYDIYEADEKYYELYFFICSQFSEDKVINLKSFEKWNWDWFIFAHTYQMLSDKENNLELSELQKEKIKELCNKYLELADFENAIRYTKYNNSNRSWTTNSICIYLWYYKQKFNFEYSTNVLLNMLEFEYYINGKKVGINYIVREIDPILVRKRIINNIRKQSIHMDVFENHIEYCIENNIDDCKKDISKYFINKKLPYDERDNAFKYLIKFDGIKECIKKYFYSLEEEYQNHILPKIIEIDKDILEEWLTEKLKSCKKTSKKMFYAKYLILSEKEYGLNYYLNWSNKNNMAYVDKNSYEDINEALAKINDDSLTKYLLELLKITFRNNFKDKKYNGIYNNVRKALINIASVNKEKSIEIVSSLNRLIADNNNEKYKNIGFINYIIEEIEQKMYMNKENSYNIKTIVSKIHELELKNKTENVSWLKI